MSRNPIQQESTDALHTKEHETIRINIFARKTQLCEDLTFSHIINRWTALFLS